MSEEQKHHPQYAGQYGEKHRVSPERIDCLLPNQVFVFGSNKQGYHGGGAAAFAHRYFGAEWGVGEGITGKCYALPTMEGEQSLAEAVERFTRHALADPDHNYLVTAVGCGIAGYTPEDVAPYFMEAASLPNVYLPQCFWDVLDKSAATIILDFGGVLMKHDREGCLRAFRRLMSDEDISAVLGLGNDLPGTLRVRLETGELSAEEFVRCVQKYCVRGTSGQQVIDAWNKMHAGIDDSTWESVRRLKDEGFRIYLLSNTDAIHWQHTLELYGQRIDECFDDVFLSFEYHMMKPDGMFYRIVNGKICSSPDRILFVDDSEANRRAAQETVGWRTCADLKMKECNVQGSRTPPKDA